MKHGNFLPPLGNKLNLNSEPSKMSYSTFQAVAILAVFFMWVMTEISI